MRRILTQCPSCGGDLFVSELSCTSCDTVIRGTYTGCTFCGLSDENLRFVELFVTCRGNVKEMERETGLGYWTIRNRLDDVIEAMQRQINANPLDASAHVAKAETGAADPDADNRRREILEAVERGELSIIEAERMLAGLGKP